MSARSTIENIRRIRAVLPPEAIPHETLSHLRDDALACLAVRDRAALALADARRSLRAERRKVGALILILLGLVLFWFVRGRQ